VSFHELLPGLALATVLVVVAALFYVSGSEGAYYDVRRQCEAHGAILIKHGRKESFFYCAREKKS
jgi:hypothetical protein